MTDFDEISRAIGRIEGRLDGIERTQKDHTERFERIEERLTNNRIHIAKISTIISAAVSVASAVISKIVWRN